MCQDQDPAQLREKPLLYSRGGPEVFKKRGPGHPWPHALGGSGAVFVIGPACHGQAQQKPPRRLAEGSEENDYMGKQVYRGMEGGARQAGSS